MQTNRIITGIKFCTLKIMIESSGEADIDAAVKTMFKDYFIKSAPLRMERRDVSLVIGWMQEND